MVTTPDPSSLTDAYSLLKALYRNPNFVANGTTIQVISNRVTSVEEGQGVYDKLNSVVSQFLHGKLSYLGMSPQDASLEKAVRAQKTVSLFAPNSPSAKAFEVIAENLMDGTQKQVQVRWGISQMFSSFFTRRG